MQPAPLFCLIILALFSACTTPQKPLAGSKVSRQETRLIQLMQDRLLLARDVAWSKYQTKSPILDPKRESQLLENLVREGNRLGVPSHIVQTFFQAQMAASRAAQAEWIAQWQAGQAPPKGSAPDLAVTIRPKLDRISQELITILADPKFPASSNLRVISQTRLQQAGFSPQVARIASSGLPSLNHSH